MRIWLFSLAAILVGSATGVGLTWYEFATAENHFDLREERVSMTTTALPKAVVVGGTEFDFGKMEYQQSDKHTFVIRNDGQGALNLSFRGYSCGQCVETDFKGGVVQPGQSTEVVVKFHTRKPGPKFAERVEMATNDPTKQMLLLQLTGYVTKAVRASVAELNLGSVSSNEPTEASFRVYGYLSDKLEILGHEFTNPEGAAHIRASDAAAGQGRDCRGTACTSRLRGRGDDKTRVASWAAKPDNSPAGKSRRDDDRRGALAGKSCQRYHTRRGRKVQ